MDSYNKERYNNIKLEGKCPGCNINIPQEGKTLCVDCLETQNKRQKEYYQKNKGIITKRAKIKQAFLIELFGNKCVCCGDTFKAKNVYDFHHVKPKTFGNFGKMWGHRFEKLFDEAKKCVLVCANCHRKIHSIEENINVDELYNKQKEVLDVNLEANKDKINVLINGNRRDKRNILAK